MEHKFRSKKSVSLLLTAAALMQMCLVAFPFNAWSGRPLVIDDAPVVAPRHVEFEVGLSHAKPDQGGKEQQWPVIGLAYGIYESLEAGFTIQRANNDSKGSPPVKGFEDLHVTAKYKLLNEDAATPAVSFGLDVKIPTANRRKGLSSGRWDETLLLILSKSFAPVILHLNLGYVVVDSPPGEDLKNRIRGGLAFEWPFAQSWIAVGEVFGSSREAKDEPNEADFQLGLRYLLTPQLVLDAAAGRSFRSRGTEIEEPSV